MNKKQREQRRTNTREAEATAKQKRDERAANWLWEYIFKPSKPAPDSCIIVHGDLSAWRDADEFGISPMSGGR